MFDWTKPFEMMGKLLNTNFTAEESWLFFSNLALGIVVVALVGIMFFAVARKLLARILFKHGNAEVQRGLIDSQLGVVIADGGEQMNTTGTKNTKEGA